MDYQLNVNITVNQDQLAALMETLSDLDPILLGVVQPYLQQQAKELWDTKGASVGEPWEPNKPITEIIKTRLGYPLIQMVRSGTLQDAIGQVLANGENSIVVGVNTSEAPYAWKHQEGDDSEHLPRRVMVGITDSQVQTLVERIAEFITLRSGLDPSAVTIS